MSENHSPGPHQCSGSLNKCHLSVGVLAAAFPAWSSCLAQSQELQIECTPGFDHAQLHVLKVKATLIF